MVIRVCASHVIPYKTNNNAELRTIKDELMSDFNPDEQEEILDLACSEPYSFLYMDNFAQAGTVTIRNLILVRDLKNMLF